jgi:hypothetical protein
MTAELEAVLYVAAIVTYLKASLEKSSRRDFGKITKAYDWLVGHETEIRICHLLIGCDIEGCCYCFDLGVHLNKLCTQTLSTS